LKRTSEKRSYDFTAEDAEVLAKDAVVAAYLPSSAKTSAFSAVNPFA